MLAPLIQSRDTIGKEENGSKWWHHLDSHRQLLKKNDASLRLHGSFAETTLKTGSYIINNVFSIKTATDWLPSTSWQGKMAKIQKQPFINRKTSHHP